MKYCKARTKKDWGNWHYVVWTNVLDKRRHDYDLYNPEGKYIGTYVTMKNLYKAIKELCKSKS